MQLFMKKFILLLIICITPLIGFASENYILPKGSQIRVYPVSTISTLTHQEGDIVKFINPSDLWIAEENIIPKGTIFEGVISMLKMPIQGINGAMCIQINSMHLPNGETKEVNGVLQYNGNTTLGGELAPPISYNHSIHYQRGTWTLFHMSMGVLQYVPSGEYEFGQHFTLKTSDSSYVITGSDLIFN